MPAIISMFDTSLEWCWPYIEAGYEVYPFDIKNGFDITEFSVGYFVENWNISDVRGVLSAPPCTDFTCSGNQHWNYKDIIGQTYDSVELVMQVLRVVDYFDPDWWVIENPKGRLRKEVRRHSGFDIGDPWYFHPHQFAGRADLDWNRKRLKEEPLKTFAKRFNRKQRQAFIEERYTKHTGLWGEFNKPELDGKTPVRFCKQGSWLQMLGGKSETTKELRSVTPTGFSRAFFEANP